MFIWFLLFYFKKENQRSEIKLKDVEKAMKEAEPFIDKPKERTFTAEEVIEISSQQVKQAQKDDKLRIDKLQLALNIEREWSKRIEADLVNVCKEKIKEMN